VKSLPVIAFSLLAVANAVGAAAQEADSGTGPNDVFRHAPRVGTADTSVAGVDVFRRTALRKERASSIASTDMAASGADSVVIDGARVALDTARAARAALLSRPAFRRSAPPVAVPPAVVVAPAPVRAAVPVASRPVVPAPTPLVPAPVAPAAPAPAAPLPVAAPAPLPAPVPASTVVARAPRTRRVISHAPLDSAQLAHEVAELTRDVAPRLASVNAGLDSVRRDYQARLDSIQRTGDRTISDTLERRWLDSTIAVARWKNDSGPAHLAPARHGKAARSQPAAFP